MEKLQPITVGRIVHFFHNNSEVEEARIASANNAEYVPAIVTQVFENNVANLHIFHNGGTPSVQAWNVSHKSTQKDSSKPFWDYPVIVPPVVSDHSDMHKVGVVPASLVIGASGKGTTKKAVPKDKKEATK